MVVQVSALIPGSSILRQLGRFVSVEDLESFCSSFVVSKPKPKKNPVVEKKEELKVVKKEPKVEEPKLEKEEIEE